MSSMPSDPKKPEPKPDAPSSPFAGLAGMRDSLPPGKPAAAAAPVPEKKGPARAVVRLEKKGRRGKEATIIEKLELKPAELEAWCREAKSAMGCGGTVEDGAIVLQGDLRKRLEAWLTARGVRKVTVSGS
jgi:translation initiation factor 1